MAASRLISVSDRKRLTVKIFFGLGILFIILGAGVTLVPFSWMWRLLWLRPRPCLVGRPAGSMAIWTGLPI